MGDERLALVLQPNRSLRTVQPAPALNQNAEGWDRRRLLAAFLVSFVALVDLVRNANFPGGLLTNDRFLTKITKVHKDHQAEGTRRSLYQLLAFPFSTIRGL